MVWPFTKKKIPRVPFPEAHQATDGTLRFPTMRPEERVIEPSRVKEAVGLEMPSITEEAPSLPSFDESLPEIPAPQVKSTPTPVAPSYPSRPTTRTTMPPAYSQPESEPLFIKVDVYQRILGEIDSLKKDMNEMFETSKMLEASEYNEEENYAKMKRAVRIVHDRLLQVDKTLFKAQGD